MSFYYPYSIVSHPFLLPFLHVISFTNYTHVRGPRTLTHPREKEEHSRCPMVEGSGLSTSLCLVWIMRICCTLQGNFTQVDYSTGEVPPLLFTFVLYTRDCPIHFFRQLVSFIFGYRSFYPKPSLALDVSSS